MKKYRISILALLAMIAYSGIIFMALRSSSSLWIDAIYTFTVGLLLVAVIAARFRRGTEGAFWFGFAVFGLGFLLLGSADPQPGELMMGGPIAKELITSRLIRFLVPYLRASTDDLAQISPITFRTAAIAVLLANLLIAVCGGLVAVFIRRRRSRPVSSKVAMNILAGLVLLAIPAWWDDFPPPPITLPPDKDANSHFRPSLGFRMLLARRRAKFFQRIDEPQTLSVPEREMTVYRLIWEPSFHHPCCVRVWKEAGRAARLKVVVLAGMGSSLAGGVAIAREFFLSDARWEELVRRVEAASFWDQPTEETMIGTIDDGDTLEVEGVREGHHHEVVRRDPDPKFTDLCRFMLESTGLKVAAVWEEYHPVEPVE